LAALGLVAAGWLTATLLKIFTRRLVKRLLQRANRNASVAEAVHETGMRSAVPNIVTGFVFWVVFLLFVAAAIESLGFTVVTSVLSQVAYYLPNVLAAIGVVAGGVVVGNLARRATTAATRSAGIPRGEGVGRTTQTAVVLVAVVVALDQIGIDAQLLVTLVTVVIGTALASAGLAFGIGAHTTVSNIVAAYYASQQYSVGQLVRIGDIEGEIIQLTPTALILSTTDGRVLVPAKRFSEETSMLVMGGN
jgi:small-conductance mechanosensitive channel